MSFCSPWAMTPKHSPRLKVKDMVVLSFLGVMLFLTKLALDPLPNIEPVSLLILVYTVVLGLRRTVYSIYIFVGLELMLRGVHIWTIGYFYVWLVLAALAWLFRRMESTLGWAVLSGAFGLSFGALCAIISIFIGGWQFALTWWLNGIPFDALHCAGNFAMALVLFRPCRVVLTRLSRQIGLISTNE